MLNCGQTLVAEYKVTVSVSNITGLLLKQSLVSDTGTPIAVFNVSDYFQM